EHVVEDHYPHPRILPAVGARATPGRGGSLGVDRGLRHRHALQMLVVDILILVAVAAAVAVGVGVLGGGSLQRRLEARRRQRLGEKKAEEERRRLAERCAVCDEPVDATEDLWERGQWWHRRCWRQSLE